VRGYLGSFWPHPDLAARGINWKENHVPIQCEKVAVLGAGVMGAQIAAHLVNVKVPVVLFDLPAKEGPRTASPKGHRQPEEAQALALGVADDAELIQPANYEEHLKLLKDCDLVIEAIAERMDWKLDLYTRSPLRGQARAAGVQHLGPVDHQAVRGAARGHQAALLRHPLLQPAALHAAGGADRHAHHRGAVLDQLEAFVTSGLGKGVVRARTRPTSSPTASASPACWPR
jgi:3-hydroxyacyl-CoA dehydrogenase